MSEFLGKPEWMFISLQVLWIFEILVRFRKNAQIVIEPFLHFEFDSTAAYPSTGEPHHLSYVPRSFVVGTNTYLIADYVEYGTVD